MITKIPEQRRHFTDYGTLKTYWLFSFSDYYDSNNIEFGTLRVFNDDIVMPGSGFPDHPHEIMEIVTIVLEGTLTHKDSMGNKSTIVAGEVQRMSAGEGVIHSEFNEHDVPVHLYQLWFHPNKTTTAGYEQKKIETTKSALTVLASNTESSGLMLHADATVSQLSLKANESFKLSPVKGMGYFIYITEGVIIINGEKYIKGDQARITNENDIVLLAEDKSQSILIEVKV